VKNQLDGGEAIVEACRKLEVDYIVSSPGTEWAPVWEAMANQARDGKNGPVFMDCWHETLAVDIAAGYTLATGRMQAVLLHAGSGLLQGAMGIHGAWLASVPMVVISGESMTYGEQDGFDPGAQWINNLSIPGGTTRLVEPIVKFATQAGSPHTIYESVIRAGEMAQRAPAGPTYLSVSTETLMDAWTPPANARMVPAAPRTLSAPEDIERLADLLAKAANPVILTEGAGREVETYDALVALCEQLALPVVETPSAIFANFPKDHELHQGHSFAPFKDEADLAIVIRTRAPWYPPSDGPSKAVVAVIDETPHRDNMVYQSLQADMYLEGNAAQTLRDLADAVAALGVDTTVVEERRSRLARSHDRLRETRLGARAEARHKTPIDPIWLCAVLGEVMPDNTIYIDEVTSHTPLLRQHIDWNRPQSLFTRQGGLGQGLGLSLGVKLAKRDQPVVTLIGDGGFLYNPVLQSLGAARDFDLPIMAVIFNNRKYVSMQGMHRKMYPNGIAVETDNFYGTHIHAPDFTKIAEAFGGYGEQVTDPDELEGALRRGLEAVSGGQAAILDVVVG
jgi:thiamine pyrophosphate-dependent acetolactate synthase large subunit-like protein